MTIETVLLITMAYLFSALLGLALSPSRSQYTHILYTLTGLGVIFTLLVVLVNISLESRYVTYEVFFGGLGVLYGTMQLLAIHLESGIDRIFELLRRSKRVMG